VEFVGNASRALGIEHTRFEANYNFSHEKPPGLVLPLRPSIPASTDAQERLQHLCEVHELVTFVLRVHRDYMQTRFQSSTARQFQPGDKVSVISKGLFLRGQLNLKLKDRHLGPFLVLEEIGANIYISELASIVRLHPVFYVTIRCPCPTATLRPYVRVTAHEDDDEHGVDRFSYFKIDNVP
jgi:hypothetical protein